jgi:hypothetical protein
MDVRVCPSRHEIGPVGLCLGQRPNSMGFAKVLAMAAYAVVCGSQIANAQKPTDDVPWIAQMGVAPPMAVNPADTGVSVRTSIGQWRDFNTQMLARRIDEAQSLKPPTVVMPKAPIVPVSPLELWSKVDLQGLSADTATAIKTGVGADYKVSKQTVVGLSVEHADTGAVGKTGLQDDRIAAHVTYQPTSVFSVEAKSLWGTATVPGVSGVARTDNNSIIVAPRLKYPIVSDGQTFEPFVTVREELSRSAGLEVMPDASRKNTLSAGTGITISRPDKYSMSVTADVESIGTVEPGNMKSRFQLSVPLR